MQWPWWLHSDQLLLGVTLGSFQEDGSIIRAKALVNENPAATLGAGFAHVSREEYLQT